MPSDSREGSRDRELVRHQHSFSDVSRLHVPMWDSSDPDRCPPPLPLNPGSPNMNTRPNTSAAIAATAKLLEDKARESAPASTYTTNQMSPKSNERSLVKGAQHRRLQSLQTGSNVRDLRSFLDNNRSPEKSPERKSTSRNESPSPIKDGEKDLTASPSPEKTPKAQDLDALKDFRPSSRATYRSMFNENTPPSATMQAIQKLSQRESNASFQTAAGSPSPGKETPNTFEFSTQIANLATMIGSLQKEMHNLSRRSKDNATDLMGLKDATNARDEDIRRSLRELTSSVTSGLGSTLGANSRSASHHGNAFLESELGLGAGGVATPSPKKSFTLPRISSPHSLIADERVGSPSPYSVEGAASVAMLEKIIREMVTKDNQERMVSLLNQLFEKASEESDETKKKVDKLVEFIKENQHNNALTNKSDLSTSRGIGGADGLPRLDLHYNPQSALARTNSNFSGASGGAKPYSSPKAADFVSNQMLDYLKKIKDQLAAAGGMNNETRRLMLDFRSEALGLGREIGEKVDELKNSAASQGNTGEEVDIAVREGVERVVRDGLDDLKQHMDRLIRDKRRQSGNTMISRTTVDNNEVYGVVKHVLAEQGYHQDSSVTPSPLDKDAILDAVKEAYESYRPEVEVQQFGLERDEILQCLKEGLEDHRVSSTELEHPSASREEVMDAVHEAMQHFHPPQPPSEMQELRDEVLCAVRECLDDFKATMDTGPREIELNTDDLLDAVKSGLAEGNSNSCSHVDVSQHAVDQFHGLLTDMRVEFKSYSAANGRDTEQVLDAMKDGLESLRAEIEAYVDRAQDVTGKDEIIDTVRGELEHLRSDMQTFMSDGPQGDNSNMLSYVKMEFEQLQEILAEDRGLNDKRDIIQALEDGFNSLKSQVTPMSSDRELPDDMQDAMKTEFEALKTAVLAGTAAHKEEILDSIQESLEGVSSRLGSGLGASSELSSSTGEVMDTIKEEFDHLRETLASMLVRSGSSGNADEVVDTVRNYFDEHGQSLKETMTTLQSEIADWRTQNSGGSSAETKELLESVQSTLEEIQEKVPNGGINHGLLEALQGEFEILRNSIAGGRTRADTEEILDAVRLGLDDLQSHVDKKLRNSPDDNLTATGEILDAINDGLDSIRAEVTKTADKPVDATVSYEILETLKEGLSSVHDDLQTLKKSRRGTDASSTSSTLNRNAVVLADAEDAVSRDLPNGDKAKTSLKKDDIEKMEVLISQLQIKVEAMDSNIQNASTFDQGSSSGSGSTKEDFDRLESLLKELQLDVSTFASREPSHDEGLARKEDIDNLETILQNTKAQLEDASLPQFDILATREHVESVELSVKTTSEAIDGLVSKIEDHAASKDDITAVEDLVRDLKTALDEMKDAKSGSSEEEDSETETLAKAHVDAVGDLCTEIKEKITELQIPDPENIPSKADMDQLVGLVNDLRESHDKFKDSYEEDISVTAKAFDDRKNEATEMGENITSMKTLIEELKDDIKAKLEESDSDSESLTDTLKTTIEESIGGKLSDEVKEVLEKMTQEFEQSSTKLEELKTTHEEKSTANLEKHDEIKSAIVDELNSKLEEHFNAIMSKYDDTAETQSKSFDERSAQHEELLSGTRSMVDDLKLTSDTLGASLTAFTDTFGETGGKLGEDMNAVSEDVKVISARMDESLGGLDTKFADNLGKIEDILSKADEHHTENKDSHEQTKGELTKVVESLTDLQGEITEHNPKFMVTLREVLALVNQHYEHSQKAQDELKEQARASSEQSRVHLAELQEKFSQAPDQPPALPAPDQVDKYDDAMVQEKLDKLMGLVSDTEQSTSQLSRLDEIHKQVMATASEVSEFVATQTKMITEGHENKEKETEEVALLLERRLAQKEQVESDITGLNHEKEKLRHAVDTLRAEQEALAASKSRLTADVASLETALDIRKEELHFMDAKADALERRIMEGIMNHSRALLLTKAAAPKSAKRSAPPFQRTTSSASVNDSAAMPPPKAPASLAQKRASLRPGAANGNGSPSGRRIFSLNEITGNSPSGGKPISAMPSNPTTGVGGMKRSHSVKTPGPRKVSWGKASIPMPVRESDKENDTLPEEDELDDDQTDSGRTADLESGSDAGTERRHSLRSLSTTTGTESGLTYSDSSSLADGTITDRRSSYTGTVTDSDLTYGTGSYLTGSDLDRRTSYGSTIRSNLGAESSIEETEGEEESAGVGLDGTADVEETGAAVSKHDVVFYSAPSDSGLGTELPGATPAGGEFDGFRRAVETIPE